MICSTRWLSVCSAFRQAFVDADMERHALVFRHRLELLRDPLRDIADVNVIRHDADFARLDFREVENVVDQAQQFQPASCE